MIRDQLERHRKLTDPLKVFGNKNMVVTITLGELEALCDEAEKVPGLLDDLEREQRYQADGL